MRINVLDHGYVELRNIAGPIRRETKHLPGTNGSIIERKFDADDTDPANAARFSFDAADRGDRTREDDLKLAGYLLKNQHTTPFEMIEIWLEMKMPIFVARQFVRHRTVSINEVSARYVQLPNEFYIPKIENVGIKSVSNKQGRMIEEENAAANDFCATLRIHAEKSYLNYQNAINQGIPNELARCFLPVNIYTKWLWNQDLHNMMHFLRLRRHEHAQFEARAYADAIHKLLSEVLPATMKLFDEHNR